MRSLKAIQRVSDCSNVESYYEDIAFCEPAYIDESSIYSDIVMNVGDINHRIIQSITTSKANISRISSADLIGTRQQNVKRKRVQFDLQP